MTFSLNIFAVVASSYTTAEEKHLFLFVYFNADVALGQQREKIQYEIQAATFSALLYKLCDFIYIFFNLEYI